MIQGKACFRETATEANHARVFGFFGFKVPEFTSTDDIRSRCCEMLRNVAKHITVKTYCDFMSVRFRFGSPTNTS